MNDRTIHSHAVSSTGARFAVIVLLTYLIPAAAFALLINVFPGASPITKYLLTIVLSIPWFVMGWWGLRGMGITLPEIGLTRSHLRQTVLIMLPTWGLFALILVPMASGQTDELFQTSLATIFQQWLFVGLMEEVLFRGYILTWLRQRFAHLGKVTGLGMALVLSSLIFSTIHISQRLYQVAQGQMGINVVLTSLLMVFLIGLFFSYLYLRTGNILLAGFVHGANNAPPLGMQGDLLPMILTIVVIEAFLFLRKRQQHKQEALPA